MSAAAPSMAPLERAKRRTAVSMLMLVVGMACLGYASVPLYRLFCQVTGFGGTTQRVETAGDIRPVPGKVVSVRFDGSVNGVPWRFKPEETQHRVTVGAQTLAFYDATNLTQAPVTAKASYNVSPDLAGQYFTKIECFCFTEQTLKAGESVRMPVLFYVDPKILDDPEASRIKEITLSYTFFPVQKDG